MLLTPNKLNVFLIINFLQFLFSSQNVETASTKIVTDTHKKVQELVQLIKKLDKLSQLQGGKLSEKFREVVMEYNTVQRVSN